MGESRPKTVRVRIAVTVTPEGQYLAAGQAGIPDANLEAETHWGAPEGSHLVWVEADVPLPAAVVVEGEVSP